MSCFVPLTQVQKETDSRVSRLSTMEGSLEEIYFHMEELDAWLDGALERSHDLTGGGGGGGLAGGDVQGQFDAYKVGFGYVFVSERGEINAIFTSYEPVVPCLLHM